MGFLQEREASDVLMCRAGEGEHKYRGLLIGYCTLLRSLGRERQQPDVVPSWFLWIELSILL